MGTRQKLLLAAAFLFAAASVLSMIGGEWVHAAWTGAVAIFAVVIARTSSAGVR